MITLLIFLFFLSLLILVHEFGHFIAAKTLGAKIEEFAIGFPPRIFSRRINKTKYSLGAILFGGYVQLKGENNPDDKEGFWFLSSGKRLFIVLAGIIFNVIFAYFLFVYSFYLGHPVESKKIFISGFVNKNSEIAKNLNVGDEIVAVKVKDKLYHFANLENLHKFLKNNYGREVVLVIKRGDLFFEKSVKLPAGFYLANFEIRKETFLNSIVLAAKETFDNFKKIILSFFILIRSIFTNEQINFDIVGPIGIYSLFDNFKNFGIGYLFYFVGILSLNLAFINFLPLPALDGGRAIFIIGEILLRKRLSYEKEALVHQVGMILLFSLLIIITFKDIYNLWLR